MAIDVDELREFEIRFKGLTGLDDRRTFYYDESNNVRKLRINADGLNVAAPKVFVLGGVVHKGPPRILDVATLRSALRIQPSALELKLKHVAEGEFQHLLRSSKLTVFLDWLASSGLEVHYSEIDPIFWSVADIIDSAIHADSRVRQIAHLAMPLKTALTEIARSDLQETAKLFHTHGYPGISPKEREPFLADLRALIARRGDVIASPLKHLLMDVVASLKGAELPLIEGDGRHVLIDSFSHFYRGRIALFKTSLHIFDDEPTVADVVRGEPLISEGEPLKNFQFVDSRDEPGIQVSDVVVGLFSKLHSYLTETTAEDVSATRNALSGVALINLHLLRDLVARANAANRAYLHHVSALTDRDKFDRLLRFADGAHPE